MKNHVRPLGLARLGMPCQLTGTGMALPWRALERVRPDSGNIVEDLQLGADLALAGHAPVFVPEAVVASAFPATEAGAAAQRTRWEHGHLQTIARMVPRLLVGAFRTRSVAPLALAADLAVPPLAFLALIIAAGFAVASALALAGGGRAPLALSSAAALAVALAVAIAWHRHARDLVSPRELLGVPGYVARKLPIYARYVLRRQRDWVRTDRDSGS